MKKLTILLAILFISGCALSPDTKSDVSNESTYTQELSATSQEDALLALKRSLDFSGFDIETINQNSIITNAREVTTTQACDCGKLSLNPINSVANVKLTIEVFPKPQADKKFLVKIDNQCTIPVEQLQCKSSNRIEKTLVDNAQKYFYK